MCLLNRRAILQRIVKRSESADNPLSQSGERAIVLGVGIHHIANEGHDVGLARELIECIVYPSLPLHTITIPQEALQKHQSHSHDRQVMHLRLDHQQHH